LFKHLRQHFILTIPDFRPIFWPTSIPVTTAGIAKPLRAPVLPFALRLTKGPEGHHKSPPLNSHNASARYYQHARPYGVVANVSTREATTRLYSLNASSSLLSPVEFRPAMRASSVLAAVNV
jgi:hypothetical protein